MIFSELYQTIDNKGTPDSILRNGPIYCERDPWLGKGFYFWDTFIEVAHWWGHVRYKDNYIICSANIHVNQGECLDLHGNMQQLKYFKKCIREIEAKFGEQVTVSFVIEYLKYAAHFPFKVIRARTESCGGESFPRKYVRSYTQELMLTQAVQICVIDKSLVNDYSVYYSSDEEFQGLS